MEFAVGQWVECEGWICKVHSVRSVMVHLSSHDGTASWDRRKDDPLIKPFAWKVGKTYRTTMEGVTATIQQKNEGVVYGLDSRKEWQAGPWLYNDKTGLLTNYETASHVPHLLPFLADEPSEPEPTEPALTERFTVGQLGTLWGVFDRQSMTFARFSCKEVAEDAICYIDEIHDELAWWKIENSDLPEAATQLPVAQPDPINPPHYRDHPSGVECIQVAEHMSYCIGNAIKYLWRAGKKGDAVEDLKKAAWYVNREIERLAKGGAE